MKRRRTKQLELIVEELQAIRAQLEAAGPHLYTATTSINTTYGATPAELDINWDPGVAKLKEMLDHPDGELATELKEMPLTPMEVGNAVREALAAHDYELLQRLKSY